MLDGRKKNFSIYNLYNYGVNIGFLDKLNDSSITVSEIYFNGDNCLLAITSNKKIIRNIIDTVCEMVEAKDFRLCAIELKNYGLSKGICDKLVKHNLNIEDLYDIKNFDLKDKHNLGDATIQKIRKALENYSFESAPQNEQAIMHVLMQEEKSDISIIVLKKRLAEQPLYIEGDLISELENMKKANKIEYTADGVKVRKIRIIEFVENQLNDEERSIFIARSKGETLEMIGNSLGITRERVRQKESKILSKIPDVDENNLSLHFETYDFELDVFKKIFNVDELTYYYLSKKYQKGIVGISEIIGSNNFSEYQKNVVREFLNIISVDGEDLRATKNSFLQRIVEGYAKKSIRIEEFFGIYNKVASLYSEYEFEESNIRALEGKLERLDTVIMGRNHKLRFYERDNLSDEAVRSLREVVLSHSGFYSTKYFSDNQFDLMCELGINNEYELHNLMKKFIDFDEEVQFLRMPNILINCKSKEDFVYDKISELSPIEVDSLASILCDDYGHKKDTIQGYLLSNYERLISSGKFYIEHEQEIDDKTISLIKKNLKSDIHIISEVKSVFKNILGDESHKYINGFILKSLGYSIKSGYILSLKYNTTTDYLNDVISNREFLVFEDKRIRNIPAINSAVVKAERNLDIIRMDERRYITRSKLDEVGLEKNILLRLSDEIYNKFKDEDFFNLEIARLEVDLSVVDDFGFEDIFLESILSSHEMINVLTVANRKIFTSQFDNINTARFLEQLVYKFGSIGVYDLKVYIYDKFNVDLSESKIKEFIRETDLIYMETMDKIYINKSDYYEEVYNEKV